MRKMQFTALICAMILLLAATACQKKEEAPIPADPVSIVDSVSSADGVNIVYTEDGPKSDFALVFVHCWCCDRSYWSDQVETFSQNYTVVTLDLAGHGESGMNRANWTMAAYGDDVAAVINRLGLKKVVLIGHSMGGSVIVEAAKKLRGKVLALVGVDTFDNFGHPLPKGMFDGTMAALDNDFKGTTAGFVATIIGPNADSTLREWIIADMSGEDPTVGQESMRNMFDYAFTQKVLNDLKGLQLSLYLINAIPNTKNLDLVKAAVPLLEVTTIDSVGHFIQLEDPQAFDSNLNVILEVVKGGQK